MNLFRRYQQWHCNNAIKAYTVVGKVLASEFTHVFAHTLKDPRAHTAIRKFVRGSKPLPLSIKDVEDAVKNYEEYMSSWMDVWNEHSLNYQAWNAEPEDETTAVPEEDMDVRYGPLGAEAYVEFNHKEI
jgi:hypothetical protein